MSLTGNRLRIVLSIVMLLIVGVTIGVALLLQSVRAAPVSLASSQGSEAVAQGAPPSEILVATDRDGSWDIARLLPDGSLVNLTDDGTDAVDILPSYDFSAEVINFLSNRENADVIGPSQVDPEGGPVNILGTLEAVMMMVGERRLDWDPAWSPDGSQLLWASLRDLNLELYVTSLTGDLSDISAATRQTNNPTFDWFATWSADGGQIIYTSDAEGDQNIYVRDIAAETATQLTDNPADDIHGMAALDGSRIAFVSERDNRVTSGTIDIFTMNPDGSEQQIVGPDDIFEGDPLWSPDGRYLLYVSNVEGTWQLYVRDAETDMVTRITDGEANYLFPVWRP